MDCISGQVTFSIAGVKTSIEDPTSNWQILLRVVGDFSIAISGKLFYQEVDFPVVEFAACVSRWLRDEHNDLQYESLESDDNPLVSFRYGPGSMLYASSPHEEFLAVEAIEASVLRKECFRYITMLRERLKEEMGLDISPVL